MDSFRLPPKRRKIASGVGQTSSASSSISKNDYELFLSFRGPDTRQGFINCLYHALMDAGIVVFKDDDELQPGSKIEEILHCLVNSKICIVVLSPKFAESVWCLSEVERMVGMKKDIVPIFYHVTPDDVKLKTDLYANDLSEHETKHGKQQVQQWRDALKEISTFKGRELKNTGYIEFCKQTAKEILTKLNVKFKYEIDNFVEVPDEVDDALKLLAIGSDDERRFVGIHGMGGIGKTTLAKIIFNQISDIFDCSCFLENIRDCLPQSTDGLHMLQVRLLKSLNPSIQDSIVDSMMVIQKTFQRKKVIIVLDDIDQKDHLDSLVGDSSWFGKGSRIIFTTRNAELLEKGTSSNAHVYGLEKKEMDSKQALKLFSKHAFGKDSPPKDFESLSTEAISTMGGLPLALQVVGSLLHRRKAKIWREKIKTLKEAPHLDVQRKLKISYDALDVKQQEIFLDIACFFIGKEKKNAVYMWQACEFDPNYGIEVLISMSLIKLDEKKCFLMHDQLRDLGRAIAACSRFWKHEDAAELLNRNVGKGKVEALYLKGPSGYLNRENFVGLEKLRFLQLINCGDFGGDLGSLIPQLRWLSLINESSFNVTNLYLRELVVLELSWIKFDETWSGWGQILISKQLKVLTLSGCDELITLPDLSEVVNLETLVIEGCWNLTFIHSSIGRLHRLRRLSITKCVSLSELPNSIGELVKLKHLSLRKSKDLRVLPDSIGDLRSLISLDLYRSGITELPTTIGRLAKLESLCLGYSRKLQRLPDSIENLNSLMDLDMSNYSIAELPRSFVNLTSLQKLNMSDMEDFDSDREWIREVDALPSGLTWLRVSRVERMENLSNLINLSYLGIFNNGYIEFQKMTVVLEGIEKLSKLNELEIQCLRVKSLSMVQWGGLQQLKTLKLECWSLDFGECQLPSNLESLHLDVKRWGKLPSNLSSLNNLRMLMLINFVIEEGDLPVQGLEGLEVLKLDNCSFPMTCLDTSHLNHLVHLDIAECNNLVDIQAIGKLKSLTKLSISYCDSLRRIEDLSELNRLASIDISSCNNLVDIQGIGNVKSLTNLSIYKCDSLQQMEDLSEMNGLASFYMRCEKLADIQCIGKLKSLTELHISWCPSLRKIEDLSELNRLARIKIFQCKNLVDIQGIGKLKSLIVLNIRDCDSLQRIGDLSELNRLANINISRCINLVDIQGIGKLKSLTNLSIDKCDSLQQIEDLSELNELKIIKIYWCKKFEGIEGGVDKLLSPEASLSTLDIRRRKCDDVRYPLSSQHLEPMHYMQSPPALLPGPLIVDPNFQPAYMQPQFIVVGPDVFQPIPPRPRSGYATLCNPLFEIPEPSFMDREFKPSSNRDASLVGAALDDILGPRENDTIVVESNEEELFIRKPGKEPMRLYW